jgi:hypothetical protein
LLFDQGNGNITKKQNKDGQLVRRSDMVCMLKNTDTDIDIDIDTDTDTGNNINIDRDIDRDRDVGRERGIEWREERCRAFCRVVPKMVFPKTFKLV